MSKTLTPRSEPVQNRARKQREKILKTTSELLETLGLDNLTTIMIAKKVGISIGTLYHYFPNKHAILFALSELWVENLTCAFIELESTDIENIQLKPFVDLVLTKVFQVYDRNASLLPLVAVMHATPELEAIYNDYINCIKTKLEAIFTRLPISLAVNDANHLAKFYWKICHSVLMDVNSGAVDKEKSLADLKYLLLMLLERARINF